MLAFEVVLASEAVLASETVLASEVVLAALRDYSNDVLDRDLQMAMAAALDHSWTSEDIEDSFAAFPGPYGS